MKRIIISVLIMLALAIALTGCYSSKKNNSKLRGLMLQENTSLGRNKAFHSRHNVQTKRHAYRRYRRNR